MTLIEIFAAEARSSLLERDSVDATMETILFPGKSHAAFTAGHNPSGNPSDRL
jgi:hypothetical protein